MSTYDSSGSSSGINVSGSAVTVTLPSITLAPGATMFVWVVVDFTGAPDNLAYNGGDGEQLGYIGANNTTTGGVYAYWITDIGDGAAHSLTFDCPATSRYSIAWESRTGVDTTTPPTPVYNHGSSNSPSSGAITVGTAQVAISGGGFATQSSAATMSSYSGGTTRQHLQDANSKTSLTLSDSASNATFSQSLSASKPWSMITVVVTDLQRVYPSGIASGEGFGSNAVGNGGTLVPATILSEEAFGTPTVLPGVYTVSPSGGVSAGAFGLPTLFKSALDLSRARLSAGLDDEWQIFGDSTCFGVYDRGSTGIVTPGTMYGSYGRLAYAVGFYHNVNVVLRWWNYTAFTDPAVSVYTTDVTLYDAGVGRPTLRVWLGGWPGGTMSTYGVAFTGMAQAVNPSVVMVHNGFNQGSDTGFATDIGVVNGLIQAKWPGIPLVYTTENDTTIVKESGHSVTFEQLFSAMLGVFFTGVSRPMSPLLQQSTKVNLAWVVDTRQTSLSAEDLYTDGLHPIVTGYDKVAATLLQALAPDIYTAALQTISPTGIVSWGFGPAVVAGPVSPLGIVSSELFGRPQVVQPFGSSLPTRLWGYPPDTSNPALSYVGDPRGSMVGQRAPTRETHTVTTRVTVNNHKGVTRL